MTPPVPPEKDIGPIYKIWGGFFSTLGLVMTMLDARVHGMNGYHVILVVVCVMLLLALWRGDKFDSTMKMIADKLPFFKFNKDA